MRQQTTSERAQPLSSSTIEDKQSDAPSNSETGTSTASNDAWQQTRLWKIVYEWVYENCIVAGAGKHYVAT